MSSSDYSDSSDDNRRNRKNRKFKNDSEESEDERPSFARKGKSQQQFVRQAQKDDSSEDDRPSFGKLNQHSSLKHSQTIERQAKPQKKPIVDASFAQFEKHTKGIGLKLLMKSGYVPGQGLGKDGSGIAAPIDVKLRPKGMGIGHGGFDEKTDAAKNEKQNEIKIIDSQEELIPKRDGWKRSASKRKKMFMTAKELIESVGIATSVKVGGKIRDMTGKEERIIEEGESVRKSKRLAELLHNVDLLATMSHDDLLQTARKSKIMQQNLEKTVEAHTQLEIYIKTDSKKLVALNRILAICKECREISKGNGTHMQDDSNICDLIDDLYGEQLDELLRDYYKEFTELQLHSFVVSLIYPHLKMFASVWNPLGAPEFAAKVLKDYRLLCNSTSSEDKMTPYEKMLYDIWLPRVRYTINNVWDPYTPENLIQLLNIWYSKEARKRLIPKWMWQNIISQLIRPKLVSTLDSWKHSDLPLHAWLFPWVPVLGDMFRPLFEPIRRKIDFQIKKYETKESVGIVSPWIDVFPPSEMEKLITSSILPKLISTMHEFKVNPQNQQFERLESVLQWNEILGIDIMSHLLETEFFTKWHEALWRWISYPKANFDQITQVN